MASTPPRTGYLAALSTAQIDAICNRLVRLFGAYRSAHKADISWDPTYRQ